MRAWVLILSLCAATVVGQPSRSVGDGLVGTWTVAPSGATVTHHIRQSLYPGERGEDGVRRLELQGNRLTLAAKSHEMGEDHERRLVWERVSAAR